jgi:hypothetical protein
MICKLTTQMSHLEAEQQQHALQAYDRKWSEELESFRKLCSKLQQSGATQQQVSASTGVSGWAHVTDSPQ